MKQNNNKLSLLAAACLLANVTSYAGRAQSYSYSNSKNYSKKKFSNKHRDLLAPIPDAVVPPQPEVVFPRQNNNLINSFPYMPRVFLDGTAAPKGFLYGDTMIPLVGNSGGFAFLDGTGKGGTDKGWLGAIGTGARGIWRNAIFGGYVFGEYDHTVLGNNYWMMNPGLEIMTPHWDLRANGYLPFGNKENINNIYFGSQLGVTCPFFTGHQQFDQVYNDVNEVAPGLDAQIGYIIPKARRTRVFGGGYYYFFKHAADIRGAVVGVELPLNQTISLLFRDSYDNVNKNTSVFTLRVYFGGINKVDENDIHERLLDPMERHIGVLYTGSGIPAEQVLYDTGQLKLVRNNIWFFSPPVASTTTSITNTTACTYENPCSSTQFTQTNINNINSIATGANFYLADNGIYTIGPMTLNYGQSIYGRTADFGAAAPGSPVLLGNLTLVGNNTLQAFRLMNEFVPSTDPTSGIGINIINAPNIVIDKVTVGNAMNMKAFTGLAVDNFQTGIFLRNSSATITNSTINAHNANQRTGANKHFFNTFGIYSTNSNLVLQNSNINVRASFVAVNGNTLLTRDISVGLYQLNGIGSLQNNKITMVGDATLQGDSSFVAGTRLHTTDYGILSIASNGNKNQLDSIPNQINVFNYNRQETSTPGEFFMSNYGIANQSRNLNSQSSLTSKGDTINVYTSGNNSVAGGGVLSGYFDIPYVAGIFSLGYSQGRVNTAVVGDNITSTVIFQTTTGRAYLDHPGGIVSNAGTRASAPGIVNTSGGSYLYSSNNQVTLNLTASSNSGNTRIGGPGFAGAILSSNAYNAGSRSQVISKGDSLNLQANIGHTSLLGNSGIYMYTMGARGFTSGVSSLTATGDNIVVKSIIRSRGPISGNLIANKTNVASGSGTAVVSITQSTFSLFDAIYR